MNIFNSLFKYASSWTEKEVRNFTPEEINSVDNAIVVSSKYGNSCRFFMKDGRQCYIPMSSDATIGIGETVDLTKAKLIILERKGDKDIERVRI